MRCVIFNRLLSTYINLVFASSDADLSSAILG